MERQIPRLVIAATQSGGGKTTLVTGLLAAWRAKGVAVQSFKVGPDYIDPGYHQLASGRPGMNLDTWLTPKEKLPATFVREMEGAELALIEGVMGLYDGGRQGISSTAEIAKLLDASVVLVIDAKSMGASAAAIAKGFRDYDKEVTLAGVILNRVGSDTHETMLREAMADIDMPVFGVLRRQEGLQMPERHLGLIPVEERSGEDKLAQKAVEAIGKAVGAEVDLNALLSLAKKASPLEIGLDSQAKPARKACRIGLAKDEAFSFYYPASLQVLEDMGAELIPFSPLEDEHLPEVDGLIIGGGFPEMFAEKLSANVSLRQEIKAQALAGMPVYAECGGYMYLMESLRDFAGREYDMAGIFAGKAAMTDKLQTVGYIEARMAEDTVLGPRGTSLHGHEFHFSLEEGETDSFRPYEFTRLRNGHKYQAGRKLGQVLGSYLHLHFAGCPQAARAFVEACAAWKEHP
ncbi:MAG: cobyrinate a,c-diamide synthase [Selenomonas sp.]|nr:cobyrinate a,c-diamide synthase [Selenomonas sp.]